MSKTRMLIVEDEPPIQQGLIDLFSYHGYEVEACDDGEEGCKQALEGRHDIILLDVMLPHKDGFTICNEIRQKDREVPVIMLTAKTSEEDIITGLSLGADDYVAKPFSVRQLVLRVEAVLRRSRKLETKNKTLNIDEGLSIDTLALTGQRFANGTSHDLVFTRREIEIIQCLYSRKERPVSREELLVEVWGYRKDSRIETRTVDIHMTKLRKKIEDHPVEPKRIITQRGEGYRLICSEN